ncbi:MAG: cupin domain-containing protein [Oscillospiraceae bacterium]|nr:cupin domain-containing protein [Oscillospiraceae bacterium]
MSQRADELKKAYGLEPHVEGGAFAEAYTAPFEHGGRPIAGCIYYLLDEGELSRFHQIDCDELWYFHEGCGMKITALRGGEKREYLLGGDVRAGERASVRVPEGWIFAAENLKEDGFSFVSCVTAPKFSEAAYRLVCKAEIKEQYPRFYDELEHLAY